MDARAWGGALIQTICNSKNKQTNLNIQKDKRNASMKEDVGIPWGTRLECLDAVFTSVSLGPAGTVSQHT